jgi:hypothetical protein
MTTLEKITIRCASCGTESEQNDLVSSNNFGAIALDKRSPEMDEPTLHVAVQRCPGCGICASTLEDPPENARAVSEQPEYLEQLNHSDFPELANSFICKAMINEYNGEFGKAANALACSAWACDDAEWPDAAKASRLRTVDMLWKAEEKDQRANDVPGDTATLTVELLRRAGEFKKALDVIDSHQDEFTDKTIRKIIDFETELIKADDSGYHTIDEALGEEPEEEEPEDFEEELDLRRARKKSWWQFWR